MSVKKVIVHAPASSANIGPGYDSLAMALELRDDITFELAAKAESEAVTLTEDGSPFKEDLPTGRTNLTIRAFEAAFLEAGERPPSVRVTTVSRIPIARGLGSSAAAIVAGVAAGNVFCGGHLDLQGRLNLAARIEGHPDNTAACTLGGVTVSSLVGSRVMWAQVPLPKELRALVVVPDFGVSTGVARNVLPGSVLHADATFNVSRVALLVASLCTGAYENLRYATEDKLHQPYRSPLVPGMLDAIRSACDAGALGAYVSGAGPSILALMGAKADHEPIAHAISEAFGRSRVSISDMMALSLSTTGVTWEVEE
ncbi:MAG: homoserine kinase [Firmicutes bacterium]|nr:homoserine kinase [Bacillota bacterium]MDD4793147.1 homoserine kinase [Bacillota bacterium]